jgi:competence protein CoiA
MLYAIDANGTRIEASPNQQAACPGCGALVISKCGEINVWHWAHRTGGECDPWYEPETEWHVTWKRRFAQTCREVVIGEHRADIRATRKAGASPCVVELQHSPIEPGEIRERESFYGLMLWIVDGLGFKDHFDLQQQRTPNGGASIEGSFKWKWPRKSWMASKRRLFFDFGDALWRITWMDEKGTGKAESWTYHEFLACFDEAVGRGVPVHWRTVSTGSLIYRFGPGHVLIKEKQGYYRVGVLRDRTKEMAWRRQTCKTLSEAKTLCEDNMEKLMVGG